MPEAWLDDEDQESSSVGVVKGRVQITRNHAEDAFNVDRIQIELPREPSRPVWSIAFTKDGVRVTELERTEDGAGYWQARVEVNGVEAVVNRRYGSWQVVVTTVGSGTVVRQELLPHIAAILQEKVRPIEEKEAREKREKLETKKGARK
jgi:hypothetical protein